MSGMASSKSSSLVGDKGWVAGVPGCEEDSPSPKHGLNVNLPGSHGKRTGRGGRMSSSFGTRKTFDLVGLVVIVVALLLSNQNAKFILFQRVFVVYL